VKRKVFFFFFFHDKTLFHVIMISQVKDGEIDLKFSINEYLA